MKRRTVKLSDGQRQELIEHRNHDPRPDVRERCAAVLKVAGGRSPHAVALEGLLRPRDPDTVYAWLDRYEHEGLEGLLSGRQGGSRPHAFPGARTNLGTPPARPWRGSAARVAPTADSPPLSRWTLRGIRASFEAVENYTLSGVWRWLAPWLNPIEKLWRWLKEDVIKMHRLAGDWPKLRGRVNDFLDQFDHRSQHLLRYVGLLGEGLLASAMHYP